MIRIRGRIGDWPVDLEIELDVPVSVTAGEPVACPATGGVEPVRPDAAGAADEPWLAAQALLRRAGRLSGPQLLEQLEAVAGTTVRAKRLLARLRHAPQVRLEVDVDGQITQYCWVG